MSSRVLIAGVSTRAAAESAACAGFVVTSIDAFADLDQHPSVRALSLAEGFSCAAAARASREIECDAVVYLAGFENHPGAVATLARGRTLWGNSPEVLRRARDPAAAARAFRARGLQAPRVSARAGAAEGRWLVKPSARGGGQGVGPWRLGSSLSRSSYLQEFVDGTPGAVVFVAAHGAAVPLGVSRQIVGDHAFGAAGYQYCGSILAAGQDASLVKAACALASVAAAEFSLVGANGIDFVASAGVPYPVEINPRWCASMELVERAFGLSVFAAHAAACASGSLPDFDLRRQRPHAGAAGKAVVFARAEATVGDTRGWLEEDSGIRDVPRPGDRIRAGHPVCTVFAACSDEARCYAALVERAAQVYAELR